jgi:hypothetical protein
MEMIPVDGQPHAMASNYRPGLDPRRLVRLMRAAVERCSLDLTGYTVLTEAASGAYAVTPVLAAMAGAEVWALAGNTRYATSPELDKAVLDLAQRAGVTSRVQLIREKTPEVIGAADIVTNSGQVRPIDAAMVAQMKPTTVIPLMYESWEFRVADIDLDACHARDIPVAGTNENHPFVGFSAIIGAMAIRHLHDAGVAVHGCRILLLCDNSFGPIIEQSLKRSGADVIKTCQLTAAVLRIPCDAVLVALRPSNRIRLGAADAQLLRDQAPGTVVVHYWGDSDYAALTAAGVPVWPTEPPLAGHMGILPSALGPEPVIRLQAGGLKVGELLARGLESASPTERSLVQPA